MIMTSKWIFVNRALFALALGVSVSACDVAHSPVLCNGFGETIYLTTVWRGGNKLVTTTFASGQCKALEAFPTDKQDISDEFRALDDYVGIIRAFSVSGEVVGIYRVPTRTNLGGLSHSPHWLVNSEGCFHIAEDLESNWRNNIAAIQKSTSVFLPNSSR